jgi:hypothetical protein
VSPIDTLAVSVVTKPPVVPGPLPVRHSL